MGKFRDFLFEVRLRTGRITDDQLVGRYREVGQGLFVPYGFSSVEAWEAYYKDKPVVYADYPPVR